VSAGHGRRRRRQRHDVGRPPTTRTYDPPRNDHRPSDGAASDPAPNASRRATSAGTPSGGWADELGRASSSAAVRRCRSVGGRSRIIVDDVTLADPLPRRRTDPTPRHVRQRLVSSSARTSPSRRSNATGDLCTRCGGELHIDELHHPCGPTASMRRADRLAAGGAPSHSERHRPTARRRRRVLPTDPRWLDGGPRAVHAAIAASRGPSPCRAHARLARPFASNVSAADLAPTSSRP
jgi:hypothetical protein